MAGRGRPDKPPGLKKIQGALYLTEAEWSQWDGLKTPGEGRGDVARRLLAQEIKRINRQKPA